MEKFYAIAQPSAFLSDRYNVHLCIVDSMYAEYPPNLEKWQRKLDESGNAPQIMSVERANFFENKYRVENTYAYKK